MRILFQCSVFSLLLWSTVFFFFKQKTAYEMRISDWSSDVCSSDLAYGLFRRVPALGARPLGIPILQFLMYRASLARSYPDALIKVLRYIEIGRASRRERVCQYV